MLLLVLFCVVLCGIAEGKWNSFDGVTQCGSTILNPSANVNIEAKMDRDTLSDLAYATSDNKAISKRLIDPERETLKNLILFLMANTKNRRSAPLNNDESEFRPPIGYQKVPVIRPNIYEQSKKCGENPNKQHVKCWCKDLIEPPKCEWMTDCYMLSTVTCGPTKPCPEHKHKWCFDRTPDPNDKMFGRTPPPCLNPTGFPVFCRTTGYTPCNSFTPPCVPNTKFTIEPCYCPTTCPPFTCPGPTPCPPCSPCQLGPDKDLYSLLASRANSLPGSLRNDTMALLDRLIRKRSVVGPPSYRPTKYLVPKPKINS